MRGMIQTVVYRKELSPTIVGLILGAWVALAVWSASPYAGLLDHAQVGEGPLSPTLRVPIFVLGWTLMTIAMMLPANLPFLGRFQDSLFQQSGRGRRLAGLILGYLAVWGAFGLVVYLGDGLLHEAVERIEPLAHSSAGIAAALLLAAGIYQLTPLKRANLRRCRSPHPALEKDGSRFLTSLDSLRLGLRHGLFCLGSCWALMLLMFASGGANLGWMLVFGTIMAGERADRWGERLTRPLGLAMIAWAVVALAAAPSFHSG